MIEGTLVVNLDPPYMGFLPKLHNQLNTYIGIDTWCYCTQEQIRHLLLDLNVITANQHWPPREYTLRLPIVLSRTILTKHGLATLKSPNIVTTSKLATCVA